MRNILLGFIIGAILILGGLLVVSQSSYAGDIWEYRTFAVLDVEKADNPYGEDLMTVYRLNGDVDAFDVPVEFSDFLNAVGSQGWELISTTAGNTFIFKRKVIE